MHAHFPMQRVVHFDFVMIFEQLRCVHVQVYRREGFIGCTNTDVHMHDINHLLLTLGGMEVTKGNVHGYCTSYFWTGEGARFRRQ